MKDSWKRGACSLAAAVGVLLSSACETDNTPRLHAAPRVIPDGGAPPADAAAEPDLGPRDGGRDASGEPMPLPPANRDRDGDGVANALDAFPDDPDESWDRDGDGIGDNADMDDDGDGVKDGQDLHPYDSARCGDSDEDRCDDCSSGRFSTERDGLDTDSDGRCDEGDVDDDGDGLLDALDPDPLVPSSCAGPAECDDAGTDGMDDAG